MLERERERAGQSVALQLPVLLSLYGTYLTIVCRTVSVDKLSRAMLAWLCDRNLYRHGKCDSEVQPSHATRGTRVVHA